MNTATDARIAAVPCGSDGVDDGHGNEAEEGHQGNGWSCAAHVQGGQCAFAEHSHGSKLCVQSFEASCDSRVDDVMCC